MKVVDFGGGLGNQLADYFNYLAVKINNPDETIYAETLVYDIPEANDTVCQWNGYELEKVFGVKLPNIMDTYDEEERKEIIKELRETFFWKNGWRPHSAIAEVLSKHGYEYSVVGNLETSNKDATQQKFYASRRKYMTQESSNRVSYEIKRMIWKLGIRFKKPSNAEHLFEKRSDDVLYMGTFAGIKSPELVNKVSVELQKSLVFKPITDEQNKRMLHIIEKENSVSIHARRSDYLQYINDCYKYGYFKRAVNYIRKHVSLPVFVVFSEDCEWCKNNKDKLGLREGDRVYFVDWNSGQNSSIDLHLMSKCKHNIITKSSFGYWGCILNSNPDKITCSQISDYITTNHF